MPARKNPAMAWQERLKHACKEKSLHGLIFLGKKQLRSLHSQRSVKRPVEGNNSQKKTFVKRRGSALPASPIPVIPSSVFPYAMQHCLRSPPCLTAKIMLLLFTLILKLRMERKYVIYSYFIDYRSRWCPGTGS